LKTLREILKTRATKPKVTAKFYLKESDSDISSEFAYISRFDQYYDNQRVVEQIKTTLWL
jgi:hypothetical protein